MDRVRLRNQLDANIQRLNYSLEIANAAGIKKPVYSNGQAVKDDPDFLYFSGRRRYCAKIAN
ncbi:ferric enterobactin transport protein FepE [Citrobacter koseri]|uniref:Ferric enterobactin transport protein FepE n=1 Tax=Citrobacter koseri TaxID=545 RepID=A0A2X2V6P2_CITKO|nr:ferric enterobactin transport protein FepE [Citrobacter koseri]